MEQEQKPPQRIEAVDISKSEPATFIFLHGFDDDSDGWTNVAHQFQSAQKLPHLTWIFPNAPYNVESRATAWYTPVSFSSIPKPTPTSTSTIESCDELEPEDAKELSEITAAVEYVDGLIEKEIEKGSKAERIVVGGFSQGCAVSLLVGLMGRWRGRLGGVVGLSGYLPSGRHIEDKFKGYSEDAGVGRQSEQDGEIPSGSRQTKVFLAHGTRDMLVPMWIFRDAKKRIVHIVGEENLEAHQYEGLGHASSGAEFRDMCTFLEKELP